MQRRRIIATAAAVFLTTASGVLAIGANLGLVRLASSDTKVGTLSPVATPRTTPTKPPTDDAGAAASVDPPVATPAAEPASSLGQAPSDTSGGQGNPSGATTTSADWGSAPAAVPSAPTTQATPPRGEPSDAHHVVPVPSAGSGDD